MNVRVSCLWLSDRILNERSNPKSARNYMFKVNNTKTKPGCEICSKLTINTPKRRGRRSGDFTVNVEHV